MSVEALSQRRTAKDGAEAPLVEIEGLGRVFDLSKRWLNRVLEGSGKVTLTAVDGVEYAPVPTALIAATRNTYEVPLVNPPMPWLVAVLVWNVEDAETNGPPFAEYCTS